MLAWGGSAVRVEEAFPDCVECEPAEAVPASLHTDAQGFQKHVAPKTRLQLYWRDSNGGERRLSASAAEVGEFDMLVEAEKPIPVGSLVVVNTAKRGFVGRAVVRCWKPKGFSYSINLNMQGRPGRDL